MLSIRGSQSPLEELIVTVRCAAPGTAGRGKEVSPLLLVPPTHHSYCQLRATA